MLCFSWGAHHVIQRSSAIGALALFCTAKSFGGILLEAASRNNLYLVLRRRREQGIARGLRFWVTIDAHPGTLSASSCPRVVLLDGEGFVRV